MWVQLPDGVLLNMKSVAYVTRGRLGNIPCIEFQVIGDINTTPSIPFKTDEARDLAYKKIIDGLKMKHLGVVFLA